MYKLLDLYCGAGGAAMGYHLAGFEVTGVDIKPMSRYPFRFVQANALEYVLEHGHEYDVIHASPPCQAYTVLRALQGGRSYPDLVAATRAALQEVGKPYVMENVPGSPLIDPIMLCGTMFGLLVFRHRLFESSMSLTAPEHKPHQGKAYSHRPRATTQRPVGSYVTVTGGGSCTVAEAREAMDIPWMTKQELNQAIPPAYTEYLGYQIMDYLEGKTDA